MLILGFILVVVGVAFVLVVTVLNAEGSVSGVAVIFIGPFPIVIGASPDVAWLVLFSIILAVLSVVVFLLLEERCNCSEISSSLFALLLCRNTSTGKSELEQ